MAALPLFKIGNPSLDQWQTQWKSILDPVIAEDLINGHAISGVALINGTTTVNHLLGRKMLGWFITDIDAGTTVYRSQALNATTLTLTAGANCTCNLWVY